MTSKTETAKQLVAIAIDETKPLIERIEALAQADQIRRELKVGWAKLGWPYDHVNASGYLEDLHIWLDEEKAKLEAKYGPVDWEQSTSPKRMTPNELLKSKGATTAKDFFAHVKGHEDYDAQVERQSDFVPPTVVSDAPVANPEPSLPEAPVSLTTAERGAIGVMSRDLLQTDTPYEEIALAIRARYPHAKTTARSLASVAADMRRDGIPCPPRRKGGK